MDSLAAGEYRVILYKSWSGMMFPCFSRKVSLNPGENQEVKLGAMPGNLRISGVTNPFGFVRIQNTSDADIGNYAVGADIDGRFELRGLSPGEYSVTVDVSSSSSGYFSDIPEKRLRLDADTTLDLTSASLLKAAQTSANGN